MSSIDVDGSLSGVTESPDTITVNNCGRSVLEWSVQAGLTADPDAVGQALVANSVQVEQTLDELVSALGVPTG